MNPTTAHSVGEQIADTEQRGAVTLYLLERHVAYLDVMSVLIRLRHHKVVARTAILRAFIEFMERSGIDFTCFGTEAELTACLVTQFRRSPCRGRVPRLLASDLFPSVGRAEEPADPTMEAEVVLEKVTKMGKSS